jgi:ribonuclease R
VVHVAIADVAHYVRPGTRLDREAQLRGNSVYFPDRVVPMLPERISNDLCSLREREERPLPRRAPRLRQARQQEGTHVPARHDALGRQARLRGGAGRRRRPAERQMQAADAKRPRAAVGGLSGGGPKRATAARRSTSTCPSARSCSTPRAGVVRVARPERLEAHRLIEEFMIQANVAAAETLEAKRAPVVYRVHDAPVEGEAHGPARVPGELGVEAAGRRRAAGRRLQSCPAARQVDAGCRPRQRDRPALAIAAVYAAENLGHFGLHLRRYAHFTSPIRRYADLVGAPLAGRSLGLGAGGLADEEAARLADIAQ